MQCSSVYTTHVIYLLGIKTQNCQWQVVGTSASRSRVLPKSFFFGEIPFLPHELSFYSFTVPAVEAYCSSTVSLDGIL